ncbi:MULTISPECIES: DNA-processing protein DprA [Sphingomonas]|uniref:DNA-processing protein DprA n=1 Tax=Sphingomonas TaxID=13687 RepID=UPI00082DE970|nr:DNA-processing protein DprA [Sphingomonas sp. CCH10-B3]
MGDDAFDKLRLIRSANVGPVSYHQLIARFGTAAAALDAIPMLAARAGGKAPVIADPRTVERERAAVAKLGARHLFIGEPDYPLLLAELDTAPPVLIVRGNADLPQRRVVAIVGARNASAAACRFARDLAFGLASEGIVVASGLARGIDTAAHQGSIDGGTIGVIASGIDVTFPPENADLQERVAQAGLLVTEHPPGTKPLARHFPQRNRIIAGLAVGTIVVEAAPRSGSLITARLAGEAGRDVMAVPGSPLDPRAQGCNQLIREGATLIQSVADVVEAIGPIDARMLRSPASGYGAPPPADASDAERRRLVGLLGPVPVAVDELIRQSGLAPAVVQMVLLELELAGRIERQAGGRVSLA